jgi:histidine triad (HIT) family protein
MAKSDNKNTCLFCDIANGKIKADIVYSDDNFFIMNDAHPATDGHCLIIPKKHYVTILDMPPSLGTELVSLAKKQGIRLIKEGKAEGFNLIQNNFASAGQVVKHVHFHIIPRKKGDGFRVK